MSIRTALAVSRCCATVILAASFVAQMASPADATEYDMTIYLLPEASLTAAIGSGDQALQARMLADADYIRDMGLDDRFRNGNWRAAVGQLVAGQDRPDEFANGFAVELLLRELVAESAQFQIPLPFASMAEPGFLAAAADKPALSQFLLGLNRGVDGVGSALERAIGVSEYPAEIWPVAPDEAAGILDEMPAVPAIAAMLEAFAMGEDGEAAAKGQALVAAAARMQAQAYGETEAEIAREVEMNLDDPYYFVEPMQFLVEESDTITAALARARDEGKLAVFVYRTW